MAQEQQQQQQEDGWPLGLRPLNGRMGLVRNPSDAFSAGSVSSFTTLFTASPTSSAFTSSDLDTQSSGSLFHDRSITLGSLMGIPSLIDLSRRSSRRFSADPTRDRRSSKSNKPCFFSLCSKLSIDSVHNPNVPSLGHFLRAERRASVCRSSLRPTAFPLQPDSPFVGSATAAAAPCVQRPQRQVLEHHADSDVYGPPLFLSRICGQLLE